MPKRSGAVLDLLCPLEWPSRPLKENANWPRGYRTTEILPRQVAMLLPRVVASMSVTVRRHTFVAVERGARNCNYK